MSQRQASQQGQLDHQPVKSFQVDAKGATGLGGRQSVSSCQITTSSQSEIKSASNDCYCSSISRTTTSSQSEISRFVPQWLYYQPQEDQETYYINSEELPKSKEHPIYHKPGSVKVNSVKGLLRLYCNSFDRFGSLKGEYDFKVDPTMPPCKEEGANWKQSSHQRGHWLYGKTRHFGVTERAYTMGIFSDLSSKTYREVRPCLDTRDLNKTIIW